MRQNNVDFDWDLVPIFLSKSLKLMNNKANMALKPYNLSSAHAMFLIVLSKNNGLTLRVLSDILSVNKAQTTRIITDLDKKNYIYNDRETAFSRNYKIYLTSDGFAVAAHVKTVLANLRESVMPSTIEENEHKIFIKTISKIIYSLDNEENTNNKESEQN